MEKNSKIFVAGHRGLVGSAIVRKLKEEGYHNLVLRPKSELDLRDQRAVKNFFSIEQPEYVFLAAAKVGGINWNWTNPGEFIYDNLMIQSNVIDAAYRNGCKKLLFLGSACIYPKVTPQPIKEEYLLTAPLEPTNEGYALAKIASIRLAYFYKRQYGLNIICPMCTNIYGTNDNYNPETSHVMSALIKKISDAKHNNLKEVVLWGTGKPKREFMHVKDVARGLVFLMNNSNDFLINLGVGYDISIKSLSSYIVKKLNYNGKIVWDKTKPDGMPRKLLSIQKINKLGFVSKIDIKSGISKTIKEYKDFFINK